MKNSMNAMKNSILDVKHFMSNLSAGAKQLWHVSLFNYLLNVKTPRDAWVYMKYWLLSWIFGILPILEFLLRFGPLESLRKIKQNPWLLVMNRQSLLTRSLAKGKTGRYHESICLTTYSLTKSVGSMIRDMFFYPDRLILIEDLLTPDIMQAMGLKAYQLETMGIMLPLLKKNANLQYIDEAENSGMNPDACSLPKTVVGMVMKGHLPGGIAIVSSNLPCDAGAASYALFQRAYNVPIYRLDVPYNFYNERAENLFIRDVKEMIAWLEKHTPGRMDWDRFRELCHYRNHMLEMELELWEMLRVKPAPLAAEAVWLSHLFHYNVTPGSKGSAKHFERLAKLAKENFKENIPATQNERYRALLWNPPFLHFPQIFNWAEQTFGLVILIDSMSYHHHGPIDTSTPETMLRGWSRIIMQGPMVRHTRGPANNYVDDIFRAYKQFDLDMVWVANHVGCKSGQAMNGMLREMCRERGIPLLILDYDLSDPRIVSHDNMKRQVEYFMDNVMKAERLG